METPTQEASQKNLLDLLEDLSGMATGNRTLELLEEIEQNRDDPNYTPPTFGELFGTPEGLNIFGEILPSDVANLADEPVSSDWLRGPLRSIAVNKRRLSKGAEQLHKAQQDFKKRTQRRAWAQIRKTPGGTRQVRQYLQSMGVRDLNLFSAGEPTNHLLFGKRTRMSVGVHAPAQLFDLSVELKEAGLSADATQDRKDFDVLQLRHFEGLLLDHSSAIGMAIGASVGHDRVDREIIMRLSYVDRDGTVRIRRRVTENGKQTKLQNNTDHALTLSDTAQEKIAASTDENPAVLEVTLNYSFQLAKARINDTIEMLQLVSGQPIFRGLSLSADEEDDQLAGLSSTPTSLDTLLDDDVDLVAEEEEQEPLEEPTPEPVEEAPEPVEEPAEEPTPEPDPEPVEETPAPEQEPVAVTPTEAAEEPDEWTEEDDDRLDAAAALSYASMDSYALDATSSDELDEEDINLDVTNLDDEHEEDDEFADLFADVGL